MRLADPKIFTFTQIRTTADSDGRFRLTGMPMGAGNEVVAIPPPDQPYLLAQYKLPAGDGLQPVHVDLALNRGIKVRGRITDQTTGKPVEAWVRYSAAASNPHIAGLPGFKDVRIQHQRARWVFHPRGRHLPDPCPSGPRDSDGSSPGKSAGYAVDESAPKPNEAAFLPYPYGLGAAWAEIEVGDSQASQTKDFALRPVEQRTVSGLIFDPDGKPVTKCAVLRDV